MAHSITDSFETVKPSQNDALVARESSRRLSAHKFGRRSSVSLQMLSDDKPGETISVPASLMRLLAHALAEMSAGNSVTLIPTNTELTTQQAADLLGVSRPYLVKLLAEQKLPFRTVGRFRRVRFDDLMEFKRKDDQKRAKILDQLTAEAQELELGY
jgi:excisionase family DNA binding protein